MFVSYWVWSVSPCRGHCYSFPGAGPVPGAVRNVPWLQWYLPSQVAQTRGES